MANEENVGSVSCCEQGIAYKLIWKQQQKQLTFIIREIYERLLFRLMAYVKLWER